MAPDRGHAGNPDNEGNNELHPIEGVNETTPDQNMSERYNEQRYLADQASQPQNFTLRGVLAGLAIGVVICFSNMYFGLQTGWVSSMAMPSALIGFAYFKTVSRYLKLPFTPVENVLVQSVAGSVGTMPLGCGFVGVIPALNYLLKAEENGPLDISLWRLIIWSVGICFFGVVFAVPLRREVIIREKLKFPSGTATALMIRVLHGDEKSKKTLSSSGTVAASGEQERLLQSEPAPADDPLRPTISGQVSDTEQDSGADGDWKSKIRLLVISFAGSALFVRSLHPKYSRLGTHL